LKARTLQVGIWWYCYSFLLVIQLVEYKFFLKHCIWKFHFMRIKDNDISQKFQFSIYYWTFYTFLPKIIYQLSFISRFFKIPTSDTQKNYRENIRSILFFNYIICIYFLLKTLFRCTALLLGPKPKPVLSGNTYALTIQKILFHFFYFDIFEVYRKYIYDA